MVDGLTFYSKYQMMFEKETSYPRTVVLKVGVITPVGVMKPFSGGNESLSKSKSSLK